MAFPHLLSALLSALWSVLPVVTPGLGSWAAVGKSTAPKSTVVHLTRPMKACTPAVTFSVWAFFNYLYQTSRLVAAVCGAPLSLATYRALYEVGCRCV